jgi:serine protease Do
MSKHPYVILPGLVLLAIAVVGLPSPSAAVKANAATLAQEPPPELAQEVVQSMLPDDGERGWLGVSIAEVTADKAKELKLPAVRGVILTEVEANSPAAKAGLKANDVVTEFNSQHVEGTVQFRRLVRETPPGRTAQLTIWRDGHAQSISVELGSFRDHLGSRVRVFGPKGFDFHFEMPDIDKDFLALRRPTLGIDAEDLSGQLGSYFGAPEGEGVLVREVKPGTPAEKAGLKAGDVIIKIDGERVRTVSDLREKLREKRDKKTVSIGVVRKGAEMWLDVEIEQPRPLERKKLVSRRVYL